MSQLIFFVLLKDFSKFTPMNAINEIELKLPQALFNMGFCASVAGRCKHQLFVRYWALVPGWTLVIWLLVVTFIISFSISFCPGLDEQ
jgi:hypothetical protein